MQPATSHADGSAQVAFGGDVAFGPGSTLTLEIGGTTPGTEHDRLDVTGDAALDGAVDLVPIGGFAPALGSSLTLVTWATRSGEFTSVGGVQQPGGLDLALGYAAAAMVVTARRRGDVDGDGALTPADTAIVQAAATAGLATTDYGAGDVDGSGLVDAADVAIVEEAVANAPAQVPALGAVGRLALALALVASGWPYRRRGTGGRRRGAGPGLRVAWLACLLFALPASGELLDPDAFVSLGTFDTTAGGSFTIDTDSLTITDDAAPGTPLFVGVIDDQGGLADSYGPGGAVASVGPAAIPHVAVFTFDDLQLGAASSFTITGHRALALLSQGDATIDTALRLNGEEGAVYFGVSVFTSFVTPLLRGGPGGFDGGGSLGPNVLPESGFGASGGGGSLDDYVLASSTSLTGAGGSHRNVGSDAFCQGSGCTSPSPAILGVAGAATADPVAEVLRGGSGGGAAQSFSNAASVELTATGGGGGGAIEIGAVGLLTLGPSGVLDASAAPPGASQPTNSVSGSAGTNLTLQGGVGAGGAVRLHAGRLVNQGSDNVSARGQHDTSVAGFAGGSILLRGLDSELVVGQSSLQPGDFGALPGNGLFSLNVADARILAGESLELSSQTVFQTQTATAPRIEMDLENVEIRDGATGIVPAQGFSNAFELRLSGPGAQVTGAGVLTNEGTLRGEGTIAPEVVNTGEVAVVSETLAFGDTLTNAAGGRVSVALGSLVLPGDGVSNDDGLVNLGTLNLIGATVEGDVRSPAGSTINVAGDVVFEGLVSGAGSFSGTQNLVVFEGGYSPGD
ncbi:MAG: dockerin type I domain-containing protein [Myxococcota bacterium]